MHVMKAMAIAWLSGYQLERRDTEVTLRRSILVDLVVMGWEGEFSR